MSKKAIALFSIVSLLASAGVTEAGLINDPALVVYYSFDAFEDIVLDESGKGHDGTVEGAVTLELEGMHDGAAKFADGGYLDLDGPGIAPEHIPTTAMTLAAWARCEDTGGDHAIFNARASDNTWLIHPELRGSANFRWLLRTDGGTTIFDIRAGSVTWDEWLHYAGTYDKTAGKANLYINGQRIHEQAISSPPDIAGDWGQGARVGRNVDNARPFTGLMDDFCLLKRALSLEEVQAMMLGLEKRGPALDPVPADEATDVPRDVVLGWTAGPYAETHDVYLGKTYDDVNSADRTNPLGALASENQAETTYDHPDLLEFGQTYYWRVDEVNGAPDYGIIKGHIWSFITEPFAYAIEGVIATSNAISEPDAEPEKMVDGSGLNAAGEHSTVASDMWLGTAAGAEPVHVLYEFDRVYKLHEMLVWNYNVQFELILGFGLKNATVEYSTDAMTWTALGDVDLAQGAAASTYTCNSIIAFDGAAARYVRLTINGAYGVLPQYGLSEVQFLYIPAHARGPQPADGAAEVAVNSTLTWRAGREAATHEVYFDSDPQAVAAGTVPVDVVGVNRFAAEALDFGTLYYWKVNEVNEAEAISVWEGNLWSFMTQEYAAIDDFEGYDDEENRIYETWIDGYDTPENGSTVGYLNAPFAERKIVHGGKQSMPLEYNNADGAQYSEASRTWSVAQDWTAGAADSVRLHIQGRADNTPDTLYVALEDSSGQIAGVAHPDPQVVLATDWEEWTIPLSGFEGINLADVVTMSIGLGNRTTPTSGATGLIYIDDVGVGRPAAVE
jgi:hypothetical protein